MSGPAGKTLEQVVQKAIYQARWIDAIKDAKMATDEEIAKTIVAAIGAELEGHPA